MRLRGVSIGDLNLTGSAMAVGIVSTVRGCGLHTGWSRVARGLALVAVLAILSTPAGSAWASFPGDNGKIVYAWNGGSDYRAGPIATSIRTVDPRSRQVRVLRDCPHLPGGTTDCVVSGPRYSPDGLRIAFPMTRITSPAPSWEGPWHYLAGLSTMALDGTGLEEHPTGDSQPWALAWSWQALAWSPAGDRLLLARWLEPRGGPDDLGLFLSSPDGKELTQLTPEWDVDPDWSAAGPIAFARNIRTDVGYDARSTNIYLTRLGSTPRRLTYRGGADPSWSPHGTKLAFVRINRTRRNVVSEDIYIVRRNGRGLRRLTRRGGDSPAWSPDGKRIAFLRGGDIYVVRATGGGLRRLVDAPTRDALDYRGGSAMSLDWQPRLRR
jgi:WD40-like Beta Propeller Repeat